MPSEPEIALFHYIKQRCPVVAERLEDYLDFDELRPIIGVLEELHQTASAADFELVLAQLDIACEYETWGTIISEVLKFHERSFRLAVINELRASVGVSTAGNIETWGDARVLANWLVRYQQWLLKFLK